MEAMKRFFLAAIASIVMSTSYAKPNEATPVQLRLEPTVSGCTFDKTVSKTKRVGDRTIEGNFHIYCKEGSPAYRLKTPLSPFANITLNDGRSYAVKWYFSQEGKACRFERMTPYSIPLHSGSRGKSTTGSGTDTNWDFCAQLVPLRGAPEYTIAEEWPLQGALNLSVADAQNEASIPYNASVMYVHFGHNSSLLSEDTEKLLDNVIGSISDMSKYHIQLHAHTSLIGDPSYNHDLSVMRLMRVRNYLMDKHGVKKRDTWGQAWGESRPMAIKTIKDEATQNRRVDVVFIPKHLASIPSVDTGKAKRPLLDVVEIEQ
jgi:outer membrane protein OmpA-like peptidoglycan-associated protein